MKRFTSRFHKIKRSHFKAVGLTCLISMLAFPALSYGSKEHAFYKVFVGDKQVGVVSEKETALDALQEAKYELNSKSGQVAFTDAKVTFEKKDSLFAMSDSKDKLQEEIKNTLEDNRDQYKMMAYTIKIDDYTVTLGSKEDVVAVLEGAQSKYDKNKEFQIELVENNNNLGTLSPATSKVEKKENEAQLVSAAKDVATQAKNTTENKKNKNTTEVIDIGFKEDIEVVETYTKEEEVSSVEDAISDITKDKEEKEIYEVEFGDCLSTIADKNHMTTKELLAINKGLDDKSNIFPGDEIVITVPKPEVSVIVKEEKVYTESYNEEVVYIDNPNAYVGENKVIQKGKSGKRQVTANISYDNGEIVNKEIISEKIITKARVKKVSRGTKVRPTFIKPISNGIFTSPFGYRWGRMHKGVDWSCPVGTAVKASCAGRVVSAGWMNGYGYCITIQHGDGKQTRYAHLSKILVSTGDVVEQGSKIALSGNTGRSTGPHLHFEILVNGVQVNPMTYLN